MPVPNLDGLRVYKRDQVAMFSLGLIFCVDPRFERGTKKWVYDHFDVSPRQIFRFRVPGAVKAFNNGDAQARAATFEWIRLLIEKGVKRLVIVQHMDTCAAYGRTFLNLDDEYDFHSAELQQGIATIEQEFGREQIKVFGAIMVPGEGDDLYFTFPFPEYAL